MPYRTPLLRPPPSGAPTLFAGDVERVRVILRPLDDELRRAVLIALPVGLALAPLWVRLLDAL